MRFCIVVLLALSKVCHSGMVELTEKLSVEWCFNSQEEIEFKYMVDSSLRDEYGWVGLGFQDPSEGSGMGNSDIVNILFAEPVADSWAKTSGRPERDVTLGGTEDILDSFLKFELDNIITYTWSRVLDTGDEWDKVFEAGSDLSILFAWGKVNEDGKQLQHLSTEKGKIQVTFSDDRCPETYLSFLGIEG